MGFDSRVNEFRSTDCLFSWVYSQKAAAQAVSFLHSAAECAL